MHIYTSDFPHEISATQGSAINPENYNNKKGGLRMKIRPLYDRLIVRRVAEEEKTKGGIIIPDTAKDKPTEGEVVAAGKGRLTEDGKVIPMDVKKGDRILFSKYAGNEVKIDGTEYLIMREEDVLGIIEKK
jgi:chaperonin GroES